MKESVKKELKEYINENISTLVYQDFNDLHFSLFNENFYIIGYYKGQQWLDKHNISVFEALETIREYEDEHFGECKHYTNAEEVVNMLAYIYGEELLIEMDLVL
tara:strand:+ start:53 stop:364 length:312 start_codon:yes stop_codon:yes gene_type:complete